MKSILLKKLIIENFKGIKELNIDFENVTNIYGENALGKTSIFDAFTWLMFDKDSKNRSTFDIKPLNDLNTVIRGLNPMVTAVLEINNNKIKLSKVLEEKWTKKRGESEKTFTGNATTYEINDVPVKQSDYKKKIAEIAEEEQFKLLTNPYYFSDVLNWKEARKIVLEVAGDVTVNQVIDSNSILKPIRYELERENVDTILKSKKASIKKLSDKKKEIPTRINECDRSIVDIDFTNIERELTENESILNDIEERLAGSNKNNEQLFKNKEKIFEIKSKIQSIEQKALSVGNSRKLEIMDNLRKEENDLRVSQMNYERVIGDKKLKDSQKNSISKEIEILRKQWFDKNEETINLDSISTECPTCKRVFDHEDIESKKQELVENFNLNKANKLKEINLLGKSKNEEIEKINLEIKEVETLIASLKSKFEEKSKEVDIARYRVEEFKVEAIYSEIDKENIDKLNEELRSSQDKTIAPSDNNNDDLNIQKRTILSKLNELNKNLAKKELNRDLENRKQQLLEEEKELGVEIAKQEKIVMLCEEFIKSRVNLLESKINNKFKNVTFKLFETQVNGGVDETCEALVKGVPFSNANTAGQINAGLDIINTLSEHFSVQAPIFIDNRESVNELIEIDSQVINLIVTKDNLLKIERLSVEGVM